MEPLFASVILFSFLGDMETNICRRTCSCPGHTESENTVLNALYLPSEERGK